jgi:hypothetical protein
MTGSETILADVTDPFNTDVAAEGVADAPGALLLTPT